MQRHRFRCWRRISKRVTFLRSRVGHFAIKLRNWKIEAPLKSANFCFIYTLILWLCTYVYHHSHTHKKTQQIKVKVLVDQFNLILMVIYNNLSCFSIFYQTMWVIGRDRQRVYREGKRIIRDLKVLKLSNTTEPRYYKPHSNKFLNKIFSRPSREP